jgi:hypothetical protein
VLEEENRGIFIFTGFDLHAIQTSTLALRRTPCILRRDYS